MNSPEPAPTGINERLFLKVAEMITDGVLICNQSRNIIFASAMAAEILHETSVSSIEGKTFTSFISEPHRQSFNDRLCDIAEGNRAPGVDEYKFVRNDQTTFLAEVCNAPLGDEEGLPGYLLVTFRDISGSRKLIQELTESKVRAEESDRLKSSFLHNISHEIRTPMNGIIGFSNLLKDQNLSTGEKESFIDQIISNSLDLLEIITNLIELASIEAGLKGKIISDFNVNDMVIRIAQKHKREAELKNLGLKIDELLPESNHTVVSDCKKIEATLSTLVANAIKFSEKGTVSVRCRRIKNDITFTVSDNGPGIPESHREKVFDRFYQIGNEFHRKNKGAGMGLPIAKLNISIVGGKIWFESPSMGGTMFHFSIPDTQKS